MKSILIILMLVICHLSYSQSELDIIQFDQIRINGCDLYLKNIRGLSDSGLPIKNMISGLTTQSYISLEEYILTKGGDEFAYYQSESTDLPSDQIWELGVMSLKNSGSSICISGTLIRVGESINSISSAFPKSFQKRGLDALGKDHIIRFKLDQEMKGLFIVYNPLNNLIRSIEYYDILH